MATAPLAKPPTSAIAALIALAAFTIFITWRAKVLEGSVSRTDRIVELLYEPAPQVTLPSLDGRQISIADFRQRKALIVTFWQAGADRAHGDAHSARSLLRKRQSNTDFRDSLSVWITIAKRPRPLPPSSTCRFRSLLDPTHAAADAYQVRAIPALVVIDKEGKVTFGKVGFDAALEAQLNMQFGIANNFPMQGAPNAPGH